MTEKTFRILFVRHRRDLVHFAGWLTRDFDDADDLVQEMYCYAWIRRESIPEDERGFIRWIFKGMQFIWKNRLRAKRREARYNQQASTIQDITHDTTSLDSDENMKPYRLLVFDAVRRLPKKYRAPIYLHEMMGVNCNEVAKIENTYAGTIKSRLYRGRNMLRHRLMYQMCKEDFAYKRERERERERDAQEDLICSASCACAADTQDCAQCTNFYKNCGDGALRKIRPAS